MRFSGNGISMMEKHPINTLPGIVRPERSFFTRDVLEVAPGLLGKILAVKSDKDLIRRFIISETEAYRGSDDRACHASKGRTPRTEIMFHQGGRLYVYFVYGMYWMLNIVTGMENDPQAVLIRGLKGCTGPGRVSKLIGVDKTFYGEDIITSPRIWIEDQGIIPAYKTGPRIGINYAGEPWKSYPWRFYL
jgi:DNA-3-methyladenine glycosylase